MSEVGCGSPTIVFVVATATDNVGVVKAWFDYHFVNGNHPDGSNPLNPTGAGPYRGQLGSFPFDQKDLGDGTIEISVYAQDAAGNVSLPAPSKIGFNDCRIIIG